MPRSKPDPALAATVRRLREGQGITREALALEAGITTGSLARVELGYGSPSWDSFGRIAAALRLPLSGLAEAVEAVRPEFLSTEGVNPNHQVDPLQDCSGNTGQSGH